MPLAALILAEIDEETGAAGQPLLLTLGAQTLLERLADQARRVGCRHIVLCAGPLPTALVHALDRLKARGLTISLARSPGEAADYLHPDENVLVFSGAAILRDEDLSALIYRAVPTLLTIPESWARDRFERIDAVDNWAGVAILPASQIRHTVAMLGEWSFAPTLIRRAIQQGVSREPLAFVTEADVHGIAPRAPLDLKGTAATLAMTVGIRAHGIVERLTILPGLRRLSGWLALKPVSATLIALASILTGAGAFAAAGFDFVPLSMALLIVSAALVLLTQIIGQIGHAEPSFVSKTLSSRAIWLPILLLFLSGRGAFASSANWAASLLMAWLAIQMLLQVHARAQGAVMPHWRLGSTGEALLIGGSILAGWPSIGVLVCLAHRLVIQLWIQRTPPIKTP
ncbi:MAG: hypothetical protein RLZZ561_843 [Pseudomonadota bacterium]